MSIVNDDTGNELTEEQLQHCALLVGSSRELARHFYAMGRASAEKRVKELSAEVERLKRCWERLAEQDAKVMKS